MNYRGKALYKLKSSSSTIVFYYFWKYLLQHLMHFATDTVSQNCCIPSISCLFVGFTTLLLYSFSLCHKFSIRLQSGDSAGVLHQSTPLGVSHSLASLDVCLGSLSAINQCPSGYVCWRKGNKVFCSTVVHP